MRTPAGKECKHYYEDFHRGRNVQECRLIKQNPDSKRWQPNDCEKCPVPDILLANADPDMALTLTITSGFLGFGRNFEVTAKSLRDGTPIEDPYVGKVDKDNPALNIFRQALDDIDDD
ncbi:MAG: hypothetical protein AAFQ07_08145 [Chloroflexota bacterium]